MMSANPMEKDVEEEEVDDGDCECGGEINGDMREDEED